MKKILLIILTILCFVPIASAKQVLPDAIVNNTITILAKKTGEVGKTYFYCSNGSKCSTEQVVREYYKNKGFNVMRAEFGFWKGVFVLSFLDEFYPYTLNSKSQDKFFDVPLSDVSDKVLDEKLKIIRKSNVKNFINNQIAKHDQGSYIRWLDEWEIEGCKNPEEYFKSLIVQEFLAKVNNKTFFKVINQICKSKDQNPVGTPDYIVWNDREMIFIEVKRKNEKLSVEQIEWGKFLIENKIPYKVVRVAGQ